MIRVYIKKCGNTHAEQHETAYKLLFDKTLELFGFAADYKDISFTDKGKPYYTAIPVSFNISHSREFAVCGICSADEGEIGVDCEKIHPFREASVRRIFSEDERAMIKESSKPDLLCTKLWTLKESYVKYTGTGLAGHMRDISFSFADDMVLSDSALEFDQRLLNNSSVVTLCCNKGRSAEFILTDSKN